MTSWISSPMNCPADNASGWPVPERLLPPRRLDERMNQPVRWTSKNSRILMQTFELMNKSLNSTILVVTDDAVVGSYADRVLFLKDGNIWSEVNRGGDRDRKTMYREILSVMAALGGDADVR